MSNVYEVIKGIRDGKKLSNRRLARLAALPVTTLESAFYRQPAKVSVVMLQQIARVFGMQWYELLRVRYDHDLIDLGNHMSRVPSFIEDNEAHAIIQLVLEQPINTVYEQALFNLPERQRLHEHPSSPEDQLFRRSIDALLAKLNNEGLMEAMRRVLDITLNPDYCLKGEETTSASADLHAD